MSSIRDSVGYLPVKIRDLAIKGEEKQRTPGGRPVQGTKKREKHGNAIGHSRVKVKEKRVNKLAGHRTKQAKIEGRERRRRRKR